MIHLEKSDNASIKRPSLSAPPQPSTGQLGILLASTASLASPFRTPSPPWRTSLQEKRPQSARVRTWTTGKDLGPQLEIYLSRVNVDVDKAGKVVRVYLGCFVLLCSHLHAVKTWAFRLFVLIASYACLETARAPIPRESPSSCLSQLQRVTFAIISSCAAQPAHQAGSSAMAAVIIGSLTAAGGPPHLPLPLTLRGRSQLYPLTFRPHTKKRPSRRQ